MSSKRAQKSFNLIMAMIFSLLAFGCVFSEGTTQIDIKNRKSKSSASPETAGFTVSNIQVVNHQIIITGTNLNSVSEFKIKDGSSNTTLEIESQTSTSIVANTLSNVTFAAGKFLDFILTDASAASTFTVNFSLCDSTLGGKGFNCSITPNDKEVLSYDAASGKWKPRAVSGLSYLGGFDASVAAPASSGPAAAGDYYIISVAGNGYSVGDWAVDNGTTMDRINNSTAITNVFGRTGAVTATEGDYNLDKLLDVNLTVAPTNGQVLKYNGTSWVAGSIVAVETDPSVTAFAKAALPTCGPGTVLKSDGTSLSCVTDSTGAGAFTGAINRAVMTDGAGALSVSAVTSTELGYLAGVTSAVQTQLDGKLAGSSFVDWSVAGVQTLEPTRLNLTTANRVVMTNGSSTPVASTVTSTELGYLSGVTSAIQTQLDGKLSGSSFVDWSVAGAQTLEPTRLNLTTANRVVLTNGSSTPVASTVTNTELGYLSGVTSSIQTQLTGLSDAAWSVLSGDVYRSTGNVGIGTSSPSSKLSSEVSDSSTAQSSSGWNTVLTNSDQTANNWVGLGFADAQVGTLTTSIQTKFTDHSNNYGELHFGTRGASGWASRLMVDQNGYVGIGTTAPATALDLNGAWSIRGMAAPAVSVAGQGRIYFDSTSNKFRVSQNNGAFTDLVSSAVGDLINGGNTTGSTVTVGTNDAQSLALETGGTTKMTILNSGNVGIGTAVPDATLHIAGPVGWQLLDSTGVNSDSAMRFKTASGLQYWQYVMEGNTAGGAVGAQNNFGFIYSANGSSETPMMVLQPNGNVGFGTIAPTQQLELSNSALINGSLGVGANPTYKVDISSGGSSRSMNVINTNTGATAYGAYIAKSGAATTGVGLYATATGATNNYAAIFDQGRVGIGITTPTAPLHVVASDGTVYVRNTNSSNYAGMNMYDDTNTLAGSFQIGGTSASVSPGSMFLGPRKSTGSLIFVRGTGATESARIDSNGNFGIGVTSPQAALDVVSTGTSSAIIVPRAITGNRPTTLVNGMIRYNTTTALFEFYENGSWVNYTTVSDARLKTNVTPVNQGLEIIKQLNPVFFDWDQNNPRAQGFGSQHQVGFIAQEVEKVLPEVVNKGEDSYRSVDYGKIVSVVVAAVKELYSKLIGHDRKIQAIDREIASVKAQFEAKTAQLEAENKKLKAEAEKQKVENAAIKSYLCLKDPKAYICK